MIRLSNTHDAVKGGWGGVKNARSVRRLNQSTTRPKPKNPNPSTNHYRTLNNNTPSLFHLFIDQGPP